MERSTYRLKREPSGPADTRSVGWRSRSLSVLPNLPSSLPTMGALWSDERNSGSSCPRTEGPRRLDVEEAFIDPQLCSGEKRGSKIGKTKRGKGTKIMAVSDRNGFPVSIDVESATPHEVKLAVPTPSSDGNSRRSPESDRRQRLRVRSSSPRSTRFALG